MDHNKEFEEQTTNIPAEASTNTTSQSPLSDENHQSTTENSKKKSDMSVGRYIRTTLWKDVLTVVIMSYFIINFVGFRAIIPSGSMEPTLQVGNHYLVNRTSTYFGKNKGLEFLDIVVFTHEEEMGTDDYIVKRVIGLPGDTIEIIGGRVHRNGAVIAENYVKNKEFSFNMEKFTVPDDGIFVLGDNRTNSSDSRFWTHTTVPLENIVGEMLVFGSNDN